MRLSYLALTGCLIACTTKTIISAPPPAAPGEVDAAVPEETTPDADAPDAAEAGSRVVGALVERGEVSLDGNLSTRPGCSEMCKTVDGTCDFNNAGTSSFSCANGTNSGVMYECAVAPSSASCTLTSYTCRCNNAKLPTPYVAVDEGDLPVTCAEACSSHGLACSTSKASLVSSKTTTKPIGCADAPPAGSVSLKCYCDR